MKQASVKTVAGGIHYVEVVTTSRSSLFVRLGRMGASKGRVETVRKLQPQATFHQPQSATRPKLFFLLRGSQTAVCKRTRGLGRQAKDALGSKDLRAALAPPKAGLAGSDQKSTQPEVTQRSRRRLHASTQRPQLAPSCLRILDSTATHCCRRSEHCTFDCPNLHSVVCLPTKTRP